MCYLQYAVPYHSGTPDNSIITVYKASKKVSNCFFFYHAHLFVSVISVIHRNMSFSFHISNVRNIKYGYYGKLLVFS